MRIARPARAGALLGCAIYIVLLGLDRIPLAVDAHAYWAADPAAPYGQTHPSTFDAYFYAPVFTQLLGPLHALPWPIFAALWTTLIVVALAAVSGRWLPLVLVLPPVAIEVAMGNIHILIAAAIVVGFRWPAAWSFVLLTKVTPGIGLIWFAARREWRSLAAALAATAAVAAISFAYAPDLWREWIRVLSAASGGPAAGYSVPPLVLRVIAAAGIVAWGGATDRRWTVPVAATIAMPVVWPNSLAVLVALIPLLRGHAAPIRGRVAVTVSPSETAAA
jgi:hypothetical protein